MTIVGHHTKVVIFCMSRKWLFMLVGLRDFSGNQHSLKTPYFINSRNFWNGCKKGLAFWTPKRDGHRFFTSCTINRHIVGVPKYLIYIYKMCFKRYTLQHR